MSVCLQGGEPTIREDLRELISGIVENRMRFSMLTNGTLITDELADFLKSTGRCDSVQVSIDGAAPEIHDSFRGSGSFHKALAGLKLLLKHQISTNVRVTIHRNNVSDLEKVAELLLDDLGLPSFSTNAASHFGLCRNNSEDVQLTVKDRSIAMERLLKLYAERNGRISAMAGPLAEAKWWRKMEDAYRQELGGLPQGGYLTSCGGPMSKLAVRADGVIVPCTHLPNMQIGRINRDDLGEVWRSHPDLNRFRERNKIPLKSFEYCRGCEYINYCRGNCPALADSILNDPYHPSPDACYKRFLEAGGILPELRMSADLEH
jgi:SynChlorMet cassette radical SAM/SPASM protein ScmE